MSAPNTQVQGKWRKIVSLTGSHVKSCKRATAKYNRRQGRRLLMDAPPTNRYKGYAD